MAVITGRDGTINIDGSDYAKVTSFSLDIQRATIEAPMTMDTTGDWTESDSASRTATGSCTCVWSKAGRNVLLGHIMDNDPLEFILKEKGSDGLTYTFDAFITGSSETVDANGVITFSLNFKVTGDIATTALYFTTSSPLTSGTEDVAYTATVAAAGGTPSYTYAATTTLPVGLTLASNGGISGTVVEGGAGTYLFKITATDSAAATCTKLFQLTIVAD